MARSMEELDELPQDLADAIKAVVRACPESLGVFLRLKNLERERSRKILRVDSGDRPAKSVALKGLSMLHPVRRKCAVYLSAQAIGIAGHAADVSVAVKPSAVVLRLQVPERQMRQWAFVLYAASEAHEPSLVFLVNEQVLKDVLEPPPDGLCANDSVADYIQTELESYSLVVEVDEQLPVVPCHRGAKEGFLYMLRSYLFFGFKKPFCLIRVEDVVSICYSTITRSTFNLVVKPQNGLEYEFSMIDQTWYERVDAYVQEQQLQNSSMIEARRARVATGVREADAESDDPEDEDAEPESSDDSEDGDEGSEAG